VISLQEFFLAQETSEPVHTSKPTVDYEALRKQKSEVQARRKHSIVTGCEELLRASWM
jgi:hypothetical protein